MANKEVWHLAWRPLYSAITAASLVTKKQSVGKSNVESPKSTHSMKPSSFGGSMKPSSFGCGAGCAGGLPGIQTAFLSAPLKEAGYKTILEGVDLADGSHRNSMRCSMARAWLSRYKG